MKKILSAMLVVCLMLTIVASAMPASANGSTNLSQLEMQAVIGGSFWRCLAGTVGSGVPEAGESALCG